MPTSADVRRAVPSTGVWTAAALLLLASPAWADGGHGGHGGHGAVPDGGWATTAIRVVALLATAVVAGAALLRPRTGPPSRGLTVLVSVGAAVAAVGYLVAVDRVLVALALAAVALATPRALQHPRRSVASGAVLAAALTTLTVGGSPTVVRDRVAPGVPLLREVALAGARLPILVTPQRPGWNLVHTGDRPVSVGTSRDPASATARMPGAPGTWRQVWLPPGRSRIDLGSGGRTASLTVDTGAGPATSPQLRTDGPECASAALGALVSGGGTAVSCPADRLGAADAAALRATVGFLSGRGVGSVHLVGDGSPRSRAAALAVREASARAGMRIAAAGANRPVILVSGWSEADATLRRMARGSLRGQGAYLAPWLLSSPLLAIPAAQMLPLRFSPRDPEPLRYAAELRARFPDETPSAAGYQAWRGPGGTPSPPRLYAASLVTFMPSRTSTQHPHTGTSWLPGGTITVATGPLT
ncbi:hypothetical protein [Actinomadura mexicana]|uniref:Uncharacterized protein n=1 Tax=Actinomadura mexicana TaxID=134959 RepID=A0A238UUB0_9ACTN|nr:hypothetical protein [Actinomadura mexicana]SNR25785.1 hypothetical protein SAMN06265355_101444 [Actinomadura mexicana]